MRRRSVLCGRRFLIEAVGVCTGSAEIATLLRTVGVTIHGEHTMRKQMISFAIAAVLAGSAFADSTPTNTTPMPETALTQQQVEAKIADGGFKKVKDLKFKDGIWKADARGGDKKWTEVYVHPLTGKLFQEGKPSPLNKEEIEAKVTAAGYQKVHETKFKDGLWTADATSEKGKEVDLTIDPDDASVIAERIEH